MHIQDIADLFSIDPELLENRLTSIKDRYRERLDKYNSELSPTEANELIGTISKRADLLVRDLNTMPDWIRSQLSSVSTKKMESTVLTSTGRSQDFIDDTISQLKEAVSRLKVLQKVASHTEVHSDGQKTMYYKTLLVFDFRECWADLTKSKPSRSSGDNLFINFMELCCEYMEIDHKGLRRIHLNTPQ